MTDRGPDGQVPAVSPEAPFAVPGLRVVGADRQEVVRRIYAEHQAFVWRTVQHLGIAVELADDATQEVFIVVHRRLDDYDPARPFRSWLWGIAKLVVMGVKRGQTRAARKLELVAAPEPTMAPDDLLEHERAVAFVQEFIERLGAKHRDVFVLCEQEGMSGPEAADALGIRLNTVYSRLRKARKHFEDAVQRRHLRETRSIGEAR